MPRFGYDWKWEDEPFHFFPIPVGIQRTERKNQDTMKKRYTKPLVYCLLAVGVCMGKAEESKKPEPSTADNWVVLFSSKDPTGWAPDAIQNKVQNGMKYLRMRRLDTSDFIIIPLTANELFQHVVISDRIAWHGKNDLNFGAHHLGICDLTREEFPEKSISISAEPLNDHVGWGFGHKTYVDDKQYYSWDGKEIAETEFEISVSGHPLSQAEKQALRK